MIRLALSSYLFCCIFSVTGIITRKNKKAKYKIRDGVTVQDFWPEEVRAVRQNDCGILYRDPLSLGIKRSGC